MRRYIYVTNLNRETKDIMNPSKEEIDVPKDISFVDLVTNTELGKEYIKLENSWILSLVPNYTGTNCIVTCLSNANKSKNPVKELPSVLIYDHVIILETTASDFSVQFVPRNIWDITRKYNVQNFYPIHYTFDPTVVLQYINGVCVNPVLESCNYVVEYTKTQTDGFQEHYLTYVTYKRTKRPVPLSCEFPEGHRAFIIQSNGDGAESSSMIYEDSGTNVWDL